jgi:hypothetical protein
MMIRLKKEDWKFSTMTRELEDTEETVLYIGNEIKEIHWDKLEKATKKHLCLDIVQRCEFQGEDVYEFLIHTNVLMEDEQQELTNDFVAYMKEKGMDEIIYVPNMSWYKGCVNKGEIFTTGEKSEELVNLMKSIEYQIKLSPKNHSLRIITNDELIVSIANEQELKKWFKQKEKQQEKIKQLYQNALELFKSKTKITYAEIDQTGDICLNKNDVRQTIMRFKMLTKIKKGKACFVINFGYKQYTASTFEKAEKKVEEIMVRFANEYRIRHLVGQK